MTSDRQNHVRVTGELLNDLTSLQVPNVNTAIFRPTNDPFTSGHRKGTKNAVSLVAVADVRFEDAVILTGPEADIVVPSGCEDEFTVRGELDESDGSLLGVFFVDYTKFHVIVDVPNDDLSVETTRDEEGAFLVEMDRRNGISVLSKRFNTASRFEIPQLDRLIEASRSENVGFTIISDTKDVILVTDKGARSFTFSHVPGYEGRVIGCGYNVLRVICPRQIRYSGLVALKSVFKNSRGGVPQLNSRIVSYKKEMKDKDLIKVYIMRILHAVASQRPSGENLTEDTESWWPLSVYLRT